MDNQSTDVNEAVQANNTIKVDNSGGIVRELGELPSWTIVNEEGLAQMLGRCRHTIKRAVKRGELPPPIKFMGKPRWTVGAILKHFEERLEESKKEKERQKKKIRELRP